MKTETFRKMNLHSVAITLFFAGVILSCGGLYLLGQNTWKDALQSVSILVAATFLTGILSIILVSAASKRDVIYLEKRTEKKLGDISEKHATNSGVNQAVLEEFIHSEQDWLRELCTQVEAAQGAIYLFENDFLELKHGYALIRDMKEPIRYKAGEGVIGRVALECKNLKIDVLPEGYITVASGLGQSSPRQLMAFPIHRENKCRGVLELASFTPFTEGAITDIETAVGVFAGNQILN